jgi:polyisoprenoid-binding protein YceI
MTQRCGDDVAVRETTQLEDRTTARRRRPLVILAVVAVVAIGALAAFYLTFFTDDAPERLTLSEQPATTTPAGAAGSNSTQPATGGTGELAGTWQAVSGSEAGYRVREKLAALPAKSDAVGRTPAVTGTVKVEGSGGSLQATDARFEADLTKLASDERRRDNRIRTDGLQTDRFPKATFVATRPIALPAETASGQAVKVSTEGDLTIHGVTRRVTIPLEVRVDGTRGELAGSLSFPMSDFAINPPNIGGFVTVDPDATLEFKLVLQKA